MSCDVTIVVPTWWQNGDQFVAFLHRLSTVSRLIVVECGGDAPPPDRLPDGIVLMTPPDKTMVNAAWNLGVELVETKRVCLARDHVVFPPSLFEHTQPMTYVDEHLAVIDTERFNPIPERLQFTHGIDWLVETCDGSRVEVPIHRFGREPMTDDELQYVSVVEDATFRELMREL